LVTYEGGFVLEVATIGPAKRLRRQLRNIEAMLEKQDMLGTCPHCRSWVMADARAFRYRSQWYHLRCALLEREPEAALEASA
jgi:hypothetical protein